MFYGWRVVGVCFVLAVCGYGLGFYGVGVYLSALRSAYPWSSALVSSAVTAYYVLGACCTLVVGDAMSRFGLRRVVLLGGLMLGAGVLGIAATSETWQLFISFLVMSVGWGAMSAAAISTAVAPWFEQKRGLAVSLALAGAGCGGAAVVPLLLWLTAQYGFASGLRVAVAGMWALLVAAVIAWRFETPASLGLAADGLRACPPPARRPMSRPAPPMHSARVLLTRTYWSVQLPFALGLAAQVGFLTHQVSYLLPLLGRSGAGAAVSLTTAGMVFGRIIVGAGVTRVGSRAAVFGCLTLQALGVAAMMTTHTPAGIYPACFAFGFGGGNLTSLPAVAVQKAFPSAAFARMISMVVAGNQFTFAFGPAVVGLLRDVTGGYLVPLAGCLALELMAAVVTLLPFGPVMAPPDLMRPA